MSRTENRIQLVGYLGSDPSVRWYDSETCMAILSLATREDASITEEGREALDPTTDWHTVYCYRALAIDVARTMGIGDRVSVAGHLTYRTIYGPRGDRQKEAIIVANEAQILEKRKSKPAPMPPLERTNLERYGRFFETLDADPDALPF